MRMVLAQHREPGGVLLSLSRDEPAANGDEQWDVLPAALAEHLAAQHNQAAPEWTEIRVLRQPWFPGDWNPASRCAGLGTGRVSQARRVSQGPGGGVTGPDDVLLGRAEIERALLRLAKLSDGAPTGTTV